MSLVWAARSINNNNITIILPRVVFILSEKTKQVSLFVKHGGLILVWLLGANAGFDSINVTSGAAEKEHACSAKPLWREGGREGGDIRGLHDSNDEVQEQIYQTAKLETDDLRIRVVSPCTSSQGHDLNMKVKPAPSIQLCHRPALLPCP